MSMICEGDEIEALPALATTGLFAFGFRVIVLMVLLEVDHSVMVARTPASS